MKSPYKSIPWIPLLAMWAYMLLCPACSKAPAPTPTPKFEVGQLVQSVLDGRPGQVLDNHENGVIRVGLYRVRFGTMNVTENGLFGGNVDFMPYAIVAMREYELEPLEEAE
ncbi:MAG: hypothetical protein ACYSUV_02060 [Planctomycetota bacterium]